MPSANDDDNGAMLSIRAAYVIHVIYVIYVIYGMIVRPLGAV
ncbi:hypothetical protein [Streptomyces sp. NPDC056937]